MEIRLSSKTFTNFYYTIHLRIHFHCSKCDYVLQLDETILNNSAIYLQYFSTFQYYMYLPVCIYVSFMNVLWIFAFLGTLLEFVL
jgi:hypothetical protein